MLSTALLALWLAQVRTDLLPRLDEAALDGLTELVRAHGRARVTDGGPAFDLATRVRAAPRAACALEIVTERAPLDRSRPRLAERVTVPLEAVRPEALRLTYPYGLEVGPSRPPPVTCVQITTQPGRVLHWTSAAPRATDARSETSLCLSGDVRGGALLAHLRRLVAGCARS